MNFSELADILSAQADALPGAAREAALVGGRVIADDAKDRIGTYQGAVGDLPGWAPLADATKVDRVRRGYTEDDPLLRSGSLRDAIEVRPIPGGAAIGVFDQRLTTIAASMEYGYFNVRAGKSVPPRSFLRSAAATKGEAAAEIIGERVVAVFEV